MSVIEKYQRHPRREAPIFRTPSHAVKPLHGFTALPPSAITVLGARRFPAVVAPMGNGHNYISIFTSTGFQSLTVQDYNTAIESLRPDIAIPLADLASGEKTPNSKRALRMAERTEEWMGELVAKEPQSPPHTSIFAPVLPVEYPIQWAHLSRLAEDYLHGISGLAIYDTAILPDLENYPSLIRLPRLSLHAAESPHGILRQVSLGADILLIPFLNRVSDAGIALTFTFPAAAAPSAPEPSQPTTDDITSSAPPLLPLGIDMSSPAHRTAATPLQPGCTCYTCASHHRAYVHHLLRAREMLGWTLLQLHNHSVAAAFFGGVRAALAAGTFAAERRRFGLAYEPELPRGTGERPRARGYHFKNEGYDRRRNPPAWEKLDEGETQGGTGGEGNWVEALDGGFEGLDWLEDSPETPLELENGAGEVAGKGSVEIQRTDV
jgi:queuine tRNA-ribosyltransferase